MAAERRVEIMRAVEECLVTYGLGGTTLDRIAEEAGMTRSNLAHFVGNRDEIIDAALSWSITRFIDGMSQRVADAPPAEQLPVFLELTLADHPNVPRGAALLNALYAAASHDDHARDVLAVEIQRAEAFIRAMVTARYPDAAPEARDAVASVLPLLLREHDRTRVLGGTERGQQITSDVAAACEIILDSLGPPAA